MADQYLALRSFIDQLLGTFDLGTQIGVAQAALGQQVHRSLEDILQTIPDVDEHAAGNFIVSIQLHQHINIAVRPEGTMHAAAQGI